MTPFGRKVRELRRERGVTMKEMAAALRVTPAYLSALEHGRRGRPSWRLVQAIIGYFNVIWDEAEEMERLARLSHPRIVIDTSGLAPQATELANRLAEEIADMTPGETASLLALLDARKRRPMRPR
ncbi:helix-turn-helix domain-containing protein [Parvibaculum sp.]|uniref:helix-turn-helix domain-containing protein n=1 Tax=Parvibaculum sp. TaxID=2024848 RepID=UPI002731B6BB|nr:helix-turn-helix transcriptional regulator [Parvibaculum sp.]MDP1625985.1 helix-turn-helix transcriptional regulator [Parvibaculum sp.]MDP2149690.1 helix-turn-helix transcriptional regulator [Parvibaculum sp.]MDP3328899.1 helix-turn-helix transcriptional regulator [Parvibaculum sp.]